VCGKPFKAYVLLDTADPWLALKLSVSVLPIIYCHDCETTAGVFTYQVRGDGTIEVLAQYAGEKFEDWMQPVGNFWIVLQEMPSMLEELTSRAEAGWYGSAGTALSPVERELVEFVYFPRVGGFHQYGGTPLWVQGKVEQECAVCSGRMTFLLSLDSDTTLGWQFGDVGRLYVFLCSKCTVISALLQCG
jgi:hypothetical protein